jgi:hypothetical protein
MHLSFRRKEKSGEIFNGINKISQDFSYRRNDRKNLIIEFYTDYDCALSKYQEILSKGKKMGNFIAKLKIKPKSGKLKINRHTGHCNFGFYERFDIYNDIECLEIIKL